mmetsp:Transcript_25955/g.45195  ORF Transcript_25955/g.45195 Transcript_25955/m.45195 type:complete len:267 (-) Transcript_25955:1974-2774(-)
MTRNWNATMVGPSDPEGTMCGSKSAPTPTNENMARLPVQAGSGRIAERKSAHLPGLSLSPKSYSCGPLTRIISLVAISCVISNLKTSVARAPELCCPVGRGSTLKDRRFAFTANPGTEAESSKVDSTKGSLVYEANCQFRRSNGYIEFWIREVNSYSPTAKLLPRPLEPALLSRRIAFWLSGSLWQTTFGILFLPRIVRLNKPSKSRHAALPPAVRSWKPLGICILRTPVLAGIFRCVVKRMVTLFSSPAAVLEGITAGSRNSQRR